MKRYHSAFKEQVINECMEAGNVALGRRHQGLSKTTVHSWISASGGPAPCGLYPKQKTHASAISKRGLKP